MFMACYRCIIGFFVFIFFLLFIDGHDTALKVGQLSGGCVVIVFFLILRRSLS